ncbi:MAG: hydrogenase maturation protease, partial [Candidatus Latescibacterota bacterium]
DAAQTGSEPGTIHVFDAAVRPLPANCFRCSTHAFGVADAIELARSLGRLPRTLRVYGVEGRDFSTGSQLSDRVSAVIGDVTSMVCDYVGKFCVGGGQ